MEKSKRILYLLVIVCAVFWGVSFFETTVALRYLNPIQLLAMRWTISALIFIALAAFKVIKINYKGKNMKMVLIVGLLQPTIYSLFETNGIKLTTTSESSIFIATIPLAVLIIGALLFKKNYGGKTALAILMAFTGVLICVAFSPAFSLGGKALGYLNLLGAITAGAFYCYASDWASEQFDTIELTFGISIVGAVFFNCMSFAKGYGFSGYSACIGNIHLAAAVIFLGVCCSCICYLIFNYVLGKLPTAIASNLIGNTTTAVGVLTGCIFAGDSFGWYTVVGLALTITGICISGMQDNR